MPIEPNIALGVRPMEVANPLAQYGQIAQIQAARNQNAMAQLQMREAEAAAQEKNMLRRLDPTAADYEAQLFKVSPQLGINFRKEQAAAEASKAQTAASVATAAKAKQEILGQALRDISQRPSDANITAHTEDIQSSPLFSAEEKAKALVTQQTLLAMPFQQRQAYLASQGAKPSDLKPTTQTVNRGGATEVIQTPAFGGAPMAVGSYADVPLPADVEQQKIRIGLASRPVQNVNLPPQEKAEQADRGKLLVKQYEGISDAARIGARSLPALQANTAILDKGFDTGFGTEAKAAGAKVLGALGVKDAENYATDAQTFLGNASAAVLQRQLEQKGPQTESDAQRITQTGAQLGNTKQANKFFIDVAKEQIQRDIDQRNFYDRWWKANKTYDGAEDAWYSSEGSKSLFERPNLKKYTAPTKANAGAATVDNRTAGLDAIFGKK